MTTISEAPKKVLVTGVFDVLHAEHLAFLRKAATLGELYIGIESDARVRIIKGQGRPINQQSVRKSNLENLAVAKEVFVLPEQFDKPEDHLKLLEKLRPDILAVSSHTAHLEKKASLMQAIGGKLEIVHQHNPDISTTILLEKQKADHGQS